MQINSHIKDHITHEDRKYIAEIVGCKERYVAMVLRGERKMKSELSLQIIEVASALVDSRKAIKSLVEKNGITFKPTQRNYYLPIGAHAKL